MSMFRHVLTWAWTVSELQAHDLDVTVMSFSEDVARVKLASLSGRKIPDGLEVRCSIDGSETPGRVRVFLRRSLWVNPRARMFRGEIQPFGTGSRLCGNFVFPPYVHGFMRMWFILARFMVIALLVAGCGELLRGQVLAGVLWVLSAAVAPTVLAMSGRLTIVGALALYRRQEAQIMRLLRSLGEEGVEQPASQQLR